ncbi:MAG: NUDIX hydrolase [Cytophagales bacterium]
MRLFVNDLPIKIEGLTSKLLNKTHDRIIERGQDIVPDHFKGDVLMRFPFAKNVSTVVRLIHLAKMNHLKSLTILTENKELTFNYIKKHFKIIKAAGGLVLKDDKILLIYRLGFWDLPKGKMDDGETSKECAVREIEEECGVKAEIVKELVNTWHSYLTKSGKSYLKKTEWFLMNCLDDHDMKPQIEEGIEKIAWFSVDEVKELLTEKSYNSIRHVFKKYQKQLSKKENHL